MGDVLQNMCVSLVKSAELIIIKAEDCVFKEDLLSQFQKYTEFTLHQTDKKISFSWLLTIQIGSINSYESSHPLFISIPSNSVQCQMNFIVLPTLYNEAPKAHSSVLQYVAFTTHGQSEMEWSVSSL